MIITGKSNISGLTVFLNRKQRFGTCWKSKTEGPVTCMESVKNSTSQIKVITTQIIFSLLAVIHLQDICFCLLTSV